jgi:predicted nucleic acid-binding Zn ribbon protein
VAPNVAQIRGAARLALAGLVTLLAACGGGAPGTGRDGGRDTVTVVDRIDPRLALCSRYQAQIDAATSPPFDVVQQIFDDNCTGCHSTGAALDLSRGLSYAHIVDHAVPPIESCGGTLVVPGDPASSYVYQKLTLSHPCAGAQMPLDELFISQPLPDCMTSIVRDWIQAGAQPPPGAPFDGAAPGG